MARRATEKKGRHICSTSPDIITNHRRALGRRGTEEGEAYVLRLGRHYDAPVEDVWDACTDPERIARWFCP